MSIWLEAARWARCQTDRTDKTPPGFPNTAPHPTATAEVLSVPSVCQCQEDCSSDPADAPRGLSIADRPPPCAGRVVSLDEWRRLSA